MTSSFLIGGINIDDIFLSYDKILIRLKSKGIKTKAGKEINHKDLRYAIEIMEKKHNNCRWKSTKIKSRKVWVSDEFELLDGEVIDYYKSDDMTI